MNKIIKFFIQNAQINYALFFLIIITGVYSYIKIPKEIFPSIEVSTASISGTYQGASIDILDKIAVRDIESGISNVDGVKETSSTISSGRFYITVELEDGTNRIELKDDLQNVISSLSGNFPSDMRDPKVTLFKTRTRLLNIVLSSGEYSLDQLREEASTRADEILKIDGVGEVVLYGDSDIEFNVVVDEARLETYGIDPSAFFQAISSLSYLFPIGKIEDKEHYFLSTYNGAKSIEELQDTLIRIGNKTLYLKDVSTVKKAYQETSTLSSYNGEKSLTMVVNYKEDVNAIEVASKVKQFVADLNNGSEYINYKVYSDRSVIVRDRLNIVISNILFGVILLSVLLVILISSRMALLVVSGILVSFLLTIIFLNFFGYSLNIISLIGLLISLGIVVDDTIIVSENIQQKIEDGTPIKKAVYEGTIQMVAPVFVASITTVMAFLPAVLISGTLGQFIQLIPIALSVAIMASLVEVFLFLPIHAEHILSLRSKPTSWETPKRWYISTIKLILHYKIIFLVLFVPAVIGGTIYGIKTSGFQLFPRFDSSSLDLSIKAPPSTTLDESFVIANRIEKLILEHKEEWFIDSITSVVGSRTNLSGSRESYPYVMQVTLDFYEQKPEDWFNVYVVPLLSVYGDTSRQKRTLNSNEIGREVSALIKEKKVKETYELEEISIVRRKAGPTRSDIQIGLLAQGVSNEQIVYHVEAIKQFLKNSKGVSSVSDSAPLGGKEIKLKVNSYGQSLGLSEQSIGRYLSNYYLERSALEVFDEQSLMSLRISSKNKDSFDSLKQSLISINGQKVRLLEVADFIEITNFEKVLKTDGKKVFYIYADVDTKTATASEIIAQAQAVLDIARADKIAIVLKGEQEQNRQLANDMLVAGGIALILIAISLLYLFHSFTSVFIVLSVIPLSVLGVVIGHQVMGFNFSMPSLVGGLGLAGVVINNAIIMMVMVKSAKNTQDVLTLASSRFRPIILTTGTTLLGLITLIFFPTGQAAIFQPLAISLGFGLFWGTVLSLFYIPAIYVLTNRKLDKKMHEEEEQEHAKELTQEDGEYEEHSSDEHSQDKDDANS